MSLLEEIEAACPYCGSPVVIEAEPGLESQRFIEDCAVCCSPIEFQLHVDEHGGWRLVVRRDDE